MMVQEIPVEFQDWRFVLCLPNQKKAFEKNWETTANYSYVDPRLKEHLAKGGNYGILAGDGHVIIETDTPTLEKLVEENFPKTLTQRSPGHNSKHFFYNGKVSKTIPLFDKSLGKDRKNIGHVKTGASYVMGPGCVHPNGGKYEFADHIPIAPAPTEEQLKAVLGKFMAKRAARCNNTATSYKALTRFTAPKQEQTSASIHEIMSGTVFAATAEEAPTPFLQYWRVLSSARTRFLDNYAATCSSRPVRKHSN